MGKTLSILKDRQPVVFFDGICNLCNGFVQFLIKNDIKGELSFASLQSEIGKRLIQSHSFLENCDSVVLYSNNSVSVKSDAALEILSKLPMWKWTKVFKVFPRVFRNWVYDFIARNRFKFFGKRPECMIPTPELKSRFIS